MSQVSKLGLKSASHGGVDTPPQHGVTRVQSALKIRFVQFMDPEIVADSIDLIIAKRALGDPTNRRIPWDQAKRELGL
jgi:hypothetical protein